jgi:mycothiol synthase
MCHIPGSGDGDPIAPTGYVVTPLVPADSPDEWIETLRCSGITVTRQTWTTDFHPGRRPYIAAIRLGDQMAGTASLTRLPDAGNTGLITWVGLRPEHQGRGLGKVLIRACLAEARRAGLATVLLVTDDHRLAAIKTYLECGFRPCPHAWDWTHRPRWRQIGSTLGQTLDFCADDSHAVGIARIQ